MRGASSNHCLKKVVVRRKKFGLDFSYFLQLKSSKKFTNFSFSSLISHKTKRNFCILNGDKSLSKAY